MAGPFLKSVFYNNRDAQARYKGKRSGKVLYDGKEIEQLKDLQSVKDSKGLFKDLIFLQFLSVQP